jgi:hypothetical protein
MQSVTYTGLPRVHICLFTSVENAASLRSHLTTAAATTGAQGEVEREAVNFAFINAAVVRSLNYPVRTPVVNSSKPDS